MSVSQNTSVLDGRVIGEQLNGKDLEGRGWGLIGHLRGETKENHGKLVN